MSATQPEYFIFTELQLSGPDSCNYRLWHNRQM